MGLHHRHVVGFGTALLAALVVGVAADAEARGRGRRGKRHSHFRSLEVPARSKTPALDSEGSADSSRSPVAGAALEGDYRQDVVDGGALLAMSADRALVLNSYRGLSLVDTSDPSAPVVLASVAVEGTGQRMFLGDGEVAVVSDEYGVDGARTIVTSVAIGASSLTVAGTAEVTGSLRDAARAGDDLTLVTTDGYYGPMLAQDGAARGPNSPTAAGGVAKRARRHPHRPAPTPPSRPTRRSFGAPSTGNAAGDAADIRSSYPFWGNAASHVARVRIAADGAPSVLGTVDVDGNVLADALTGNEAVLAVQSTNYDAWAGVNDASAQPGVWAPPAVSLIHLADNAQGEPLTVGTLELAGVGGVAALDLAGTQLRAVEWTDSGEVLATFDLADGSIVPEDSVALGEWPSAFAFSGGAFVYGTTQWNYGPPVEGDPVLGGKEVANAMSSAGGDQSGPTSALASIDLTDPENLVAGTSVDLGSGWISGFTAVPDGVVVARYAYDDSEGHTALVRVDVSDPATPVVADTENLPGYVSPGRALGDLLFVDGGETAEDGSFQPFTRLVDLSGGVLTLGGTFSVGSWTTAAAREGDLVGLAAYDRLTLVDVSDPANPSALGEIRLVVNVSGFAALSATTGAALTTDYLGGDVEIRTVSLPAANALAPLDAIHVATGDAQMFAAAPFLYVVATDWRTGRATIQVVDATDPEHLELRGSLDLASYPGQVFLKGTTLLLLREAYTLFEETDDGKMRSASDAFGNCPRSWLRDELTATLDVVDLSDPDRPSAAERLRMRWDFAGQATLSGDSLYVPSYLYVAGSDPDAGGSYAYQIREIDVSDPLNPLTRRAVDVPGTLVAATGVPHQVLTADYAYDSETGATTSTLFLVDLRAAWQERVLAKTELPGYPESVSVGGDHAYVVTESWNEKGASAALTTLALSDLSTENTAARERGAWNGEIEGSYLFLRTWGWTGAIDVYSLATPSAPSSLASHEVAGWSGDVTLVSGRVYVPGGLFGVQSFDLSK